MRHTSGMQRVWPWLRAGVLWVFEEWGCEVWAKSSATCIHSKHAACLAVAVGVGVCVYEECVMWTCRVAPHTAPLQQLPAG